MQLVELSSPGPSYSLTIVPTLLLLAVLLLKIYTNGGSRLNTYLRLVSLDPLFCPGFGYGVMGVETGANRG